MSYRREDGTFEPLGAETPDERHRRLTGARADALLADPAALAAWVASLQSRLAARRASACLTTESPAPAHHNGARP